MKFISKHASKIIIVLILILAILVTLLYFDSLESQEEIMLKPKIKKTIIIGDSRMEYINNGNDYIKQIPLNMEFIAKSGEEFEWFNKKAVPKMLKMLNDNSSVYNIVINMGVNDIQYLKYNDKDTNYIANRYNNSFAMLATLYPNVNFYIMSVNPINEKVINDYFVNNVRTNNQIDELNQRISTYINNLKNDNIKYCDSNKSINFDTKDGLHYTVSTNEKIIKYILNDCLN